MAPAQLLPVEDGSPEDDTPCAGCPLSRRDFLQAGSGLAAGAALAGGVEQALAQQVDPPVAPGSTVRPVRLNVNGRDYPLQLEPRVTLLDALREYMGLMGTKKGCDRGQCGACTVLVNGQRVNACLLLAVMAEGSPITTIEGLGQPGALHPMQAAFLQQDAFQCGYCTPGQICSAVGALTELRQGIPSAATPDVRQAALQLTDAELRERMSGNICRCGAYNNIVIAVRSVATGA